MVETQHEISRQTKPHLSEQMKFRDNTLLFTHPVRFFKTQMNEYEDIEYQYRPILSMEKDDNGRILSATYGEQNSITVVEFTNLREAIKDNITEDFGFLSQNLADLTALEIRRNHKPVEPE